MFILHWKLHWAASPGGETRDRVGEGLPSGSVWPSRGHMALTRNPDLFLGQGPCWTQDQGFAHMWLVFVKCMFAHRDVTVRCPV